LIHPAFHPAEAGKEYHLFKSCVAEGDPCQRKILGADYPSTISRSYGAGFAGQKESSLREKKPKEMKKYGYK